MDEMEAELDEWKVVLLEYYSSTGVQLIEIFFMIFYFLRFFKSNWPRSVFVVYTEATKNCTKQHILLEDSFCLFYHSFP